jgi:hypothetical protein
MINRFVSGIALVLLSLPLTACSGGDDDSTGSGGSGGTGGTSQTKTSPWSGHTYLLSLASTDWTTPRKVGTDLFGVAPAFMFKITGEGDNLTATVGTGPGTYLTDPTDTTTAVPVTPAQAMQDPCGVTTDVPFSASAYPNATINEDHSKLFVKNAGKALQATADVYGLKFTNILPNGTTPSTTGTLDASMDFRELYVLFGALGPGRTPDSVCANVKSAYTPSSCTDPSCTVQCQACPDGQPYCLSVEALGVGAVEAPNLVVNQITETSRSASACADSPKP